MALEDDPEAVVEGAAIGGIDLPPQLLFVHQVIFYMIWHILSISCVLVRVSRI